MFNLRAILQFFSINVIKDHVICLTFFVLNNQKDSIQHNLGASKHTHCGRMRCFAIATFRVFYWISYQCIDVEPCVYTIDVRRVIMNTTVI